MLSLSELLERFKIKYYEFKQTEKNEEFISVKDYLSIEETESTDEDLSDEDILDLVLNNDCDDENLNSNVSETKDQHRPPFREDLSSLEVLQTYVETSKGGENLIDLIDNLKESMSELRVENLRQNSIVNYFKKI